jgi:GxxExxY protein
MTLISELPLVLPDRRSDLLHSHITGDILNAALEVHQELGPGLLESAYQVCLCHELSRRGRSFRAEVPLPIRYKDVQLDCAYRMDLLVEDKVAVELKAVDKILPIHQA